MIVGNFYDIKVKVDKPTVLLYLHLIRYEEHVLSYRQL